MNYTLTITDTKVTFAEQASHPKLTHASEQWLVQQGVGDLQNKDHVWQFVPTIKPRHGIAACLQPKTETFGSLFCFLPLPIATRLPVHMNGQFILGSTRRQLWVSTIPGEKDDRQRWNDQIFAALCSSYTHFLENAKEYIFYGSTLYRKYDLLHDIHFYYSLFPVDRKLGEIQFNLIGDWRAFANNVFKSLHSQNCRILASIESVAEVLQNVGNQG